MNGTNCNDNERGLLPYPVILAATKGDPDAMKIVVQHYQSYIAHLSMRKLRDESGNTYYGIDEDLRERLQAKLMRAVLSFKTCLLYTSERVQPAGQYLDGNPDPQLGKFERFEAQPNDPEALHFLMREEKRSYDRLKPGDFKTHITALHDSQMCIRDRYREMQNGRSQHNLSCLLCNHE